MVMMKSLETAESARATFRAGGLPGQGLPARQSITPSGATSGCCRRKLQRHAVDAVAQACRRRTIGEDVAKMAAAGGAVHFGAHHAPVAILRGFDRAGDRIVEARPAGAALEFQLRLEQGRVAGDAGKDTRAMLVQQRAAAGPLRAVAAHDLVLVGRQELAPFGVGVVDLIELGIHSLFLPDWPATRGRLLIRNKSGRRRPASTLLHEMLSMEQHGFATPPRI